MSLFPFCVCKACRKWETWVSTIGRQEKEAGKLILHKLGKGHCKMLSICHTQLAACFQGAEEKGLCFYVRSVLYLIPPHRWRLRENLMAELREWAFVNVQNSSIRSTFCLRVPFLFAQFHLHYKPIHIFWFTSLHALLIQFNLEVVLRLACVHECDSNCRKYLLFFNWCHFFSFRRAVQPCERVIRLADVSQKANRFRWMLPATLPCKICLQSSSAGSEVDGGRWRFSVSWSNLAVKLILSPQFCKTKNVSRAVLHGHDLYRKNHGHHFQFSALIVFVSVQLMGKQTLCDLWSCFGFQCLH